jgi:cation transport regulator ChaB
MNNFETSFGPDRNYSKEECSSYLNQARDLQRSLQREGGQMSLPEAVRRVIPKNAKGLYRAVMSVASERSAHKRSADARQRRYERGESVEPATRPAPPSPSESSGSPEQAPTQNEEDLFGEDEARRQSGRGYGSGI